MSNLVELQRNFIINILKEVRTEHNIKFLVIDDVVDQLIDSLFADRNDLLTYVTAVDRIDSPKRKGQSSVEVIYLLKATKFNINCMDADFGNHSIKYKRAHIRFLSEFPRNLVDHFNKRRYLTSNVADLKVINCAFTPKEYQYFETLGIDKPLQIFYNPTCKDLVDIGIYKTVQSLLNVCIITGEYPIVRYSEPTAEEYALNEATLLPKRVAMAFQQELDDYARDHNDFPPENSRPRAIMVITDRVLDLFSPVLHDFSYQALAYDISKNIDRRTDTYSYKVENETGVMEPKTSRLSDLLDPDWVTMKHFHIVDASEYLTSKVNELIAKNPLLVDRANVKDTSDLLNVVAHLKDFDEERRRIALHRTLLDECFEHSKTCKLAEHAEIEQILAGYGTDFDGEKCKHISEKLIEHLSDTSSAVTDRVRYIIEYALYRGGIIDFDFIKLLAFIGVDKSNSWFKHFMQLFKNFNYLGFKLVKDKPKDKPFQKEWTHDTIVNDSTIYQTSRYIPSVGNILGKVITNPLLLKEEQFPYVKDKPIELLEADVADSLNTKSTQPTSLRNPRHKAAWAKTTTQPKGNRQRFFYYVIGGITYSEIKACYDQSKLNNKDVFVGSDSIWTPLQFMANVEDLTKPRELLRLREDAPVREEPPEFLTASNPPIATAPKHIHTVSISQPSRKVERDTTNKEPEVAKKQSKLSRFLKRK
ncbi:Sec1p [Kluyveromyces lactis]|uniref:KLLA0D17028p n=1 Tax=Kluyveromyces lactis (strain ATCC 8585 / CBS 2359 / DSM 70799 / NBRC 1267 / NRRL Y-1140 / WM37) TaxID=284590 RepID=Q6CQH6_KLULA|nr:uncharacterized protein KLLA0_D17028g [Kluyveromyces lactis]CAH00909.1 KLLA0D17028p [Kluyveromyces lactis]|eukprot:XP_453813.1 uncharacterized protein KLLA0_D17028g [Kluyveromyces lactis]